jgi:gamma-glutamyltranspeptidase
MGNHFNIEKEGFEELPNKTELEQELVLFNQKSLFFGGVHSIVKEKGKLVAVADERRDGAIM